MGSAEEHLGNPAESHVMGRVFEDCWKPWSTSSRSGLSVKAAFPFSLMDLPVTKGEIISIKRRSNSSLNLNPDLWILKSELFLPLQVQSRRHSGY